MAALNEQEEFEFRLRAEQEAQEPSIAGQLKYQAGRAGRMILEGAGDLAGIVGNPISALTGGALRRPSDIATDMATRIALPENVTDTEKLTGSVGRGLVGSAGMIGASRLASRIPGIAGQAGKFFAQQPVAQLTAAGSGAASSELARQHGYGPGGQIVAGLVGGMAPTAAVNLGGKLISATGRVLLTYLAR
jgi:hypothetical protein